MVRFSDRIAPLVEPFAAVLSSPARSGAIPGMATPIIVRAGSRAASGGDGGDGADGAGGGAPPNRSDAAIPIIVRLSVARRGALATGATTGARAGGSGAGASARVCAGIVCANARDSGVDASGCVVATREGGAAAAAPAGTLNSIIVRFFVSRESAGAGSVGGPISDTPPHWPQNFACSGIE